MLDVIFYRSVKVCNRNREVGESPRIRLRGQAVKTSPFHGGNTGSIPVGVIDDPQGYMDL